MIKTFYDEYWDGFGVSHRCEVCEVEVTLDQLFGSELEAEFAGELEMILHATLPHVVSLEGAFYYGTP